jgi:peptidoglycan/xylan/chitin deacetylase (PgdA/CDA1 family)
MFHPPQRLSAWCPFILFFWATCLSPPTLHAAPPVELPGARIELVDYQGPATFTVRAPEKFKLQIDLTPNTERRPLTFRIELAQSGRDTWPFQDVEVRDSAERAMPVRRAGIEWHRLFLTVPAEPAAYVVQAVEPPGLRPGTFPEKQREAGDSLTGLRAAICNWHDGRRAALSIRFDDSHPTHLSKAIPILREYGFRGTFMVNPGAFPPGSRQRSAFQDQLGEWQAVALRGDQEFANHTAHHRGAENDEEMDRQVGEASQAIWKLSPGNSKLLALNLGGGTWWTTTRPLRYYLDKYHLFDISGSLGMDDVYGNRVAAFREHLERHIERAGWCKIHFHSIGDGQAASEANFRAALDLARQHESDLWIAGMADIHKYQAERAGATLALEGKTATHAVLKLTCSTDSQLFDQPLTLQIALPESWPADDVVVTNPAAERLPAQRQSTPDGGIIRFDVPPVTGEFQIRR